MADKVIPPLKTIPEEKEEMNYICEVLRVDLFSLYSVPKPPENLNWSRLAALLRKHRLASRFYTIISEHENDFPEAFLLELKKARYGLLIYGDGSILQIKRILNALEESGIQVIVLKGWAMIPTLYGGDYSQRFCEDIDLLIKPQDVDSVESLLNSVGFVGSPEVHPGYSRRFANARAYFQTNQDAMQPGKFSVGLHWGLTHYPSFQPDKIQIEDLFGNASSLVIEGNEVLQLHTEDDLVYTCAHLALHHRNQETLLQYYEIAYRFRRTIELLNWKQLIQKAERWGYSVQVKKILLDLELLWQLIIPPGLHDEIAAYNPPIKARVVDKLVSFTKGNAIIVSLVQFLAMPGWKNKLVSMFQQLFPGRDYMKYRYRSSDDPLLILYLRRMFGAFIGMITQG